MQIKAIMSFNFTVGRMAIIKMIGDEKLLVRGWGEMGTLVALLMGM